MVVFILACLPYILTWLISSDDREAYIARTVDSDNVAVDTGEGIKEIDFDDYAAGVLALQTDEDSHAEAVKAQAVIVRTNLLAALTAGGTLEEPYLTIAQMEQRGIAAKMLDAVKATKGQALYYEGQPILASFHAISAGMTRDAKEALKSEAYPYLTRVDSSSDIGSEDFLKRTVLAPQEILEKCRTACPDLKLSGETLKIRILSRDSAGYVLSVKVGDTVLPGEQFRKLLDLPSSCFTMEMEEGMIVTVTKGLGHGLGLSQYGAEVMAQGGSTYEEILAYYYPGTVLQKKN